MLLPRMIKKRILYFIKGESPTQQEMADAAAIGTKMFRNVTYIFQDHSVENCDGVAGSVPDAYKGFPLVEAPKEPIQEAPKEPVQTKKK